MLQWASTGTCFMSIDKDLAFSLNSMATKFFPALWTIRSGGPFYTSIQRSLSSIQVSFASIIFRIRADWNAVAVSITRRTGLFLSRYIISTIISELNSRSSLMLKRNRPGDRLYSWHSWQNLFIFRCASAFNFSFALKSNFEKFWTEGWPNRR